ncbi:MAG: hypothetical protein CVV11_10935 [Gammaproteobacteria bacterium HGW-Gammaproteobacteria-15]|nr:MAG: hypothetical protein CVV11_10935 [Gammaproteobacteria bacterium HGW-Gammaproteobacteria-15]
MSINKPKVLFGADIAAFYCLFALGLSCSLSACSDPVQQRGAEHYTLQANYVGAFYVIFDQSSGEPLQYQHNTRQYRLPANGVLLTQAEINEGAIAARMRLHS